MTLRGAIGFSAALHLLVFTAASFSGWLPKRQRRFEVSYLPAPAVNPVLPVRSAPTVSRAVFAPMPAAPPPVPPAPRPASLPPVHGTEAPLVSVPRPMVSSLPEKEFIFLDHKERVRKHLKAHLNYPSFLSDGTVRLRLILGPEGVFKQALVLETSDPRLTGVAVRDAQAASPYPKLPGKSRPRQVRYEFLIRYRSES